MATTGSRARSSAEPGKERLFALPRGYRDRNQPAPLMKTLIVLAIASLSGLAALVAGLALGLGVGPLFALTLAALLLLLWAGDYRTYRHLGAHFIPRRP
jgi:hypothetical protein